jgi:hypothetical protein
MYNDLCIRKWHESYEESNDGMTVKAFNEIDIGVGRRKRASCGPHQATSTGRWKEGCVDEARAST